MSSTGRGWPVCFRKVLEARWRAAQIASSTSVSSGTVKPVTSRSRCAPRAISIHGRC